MNLFESVILGIVQGLTEFLPISSSAHLVLVPFFFRWEDPGLAFDVALHMGTLLAILVFFWKDWLLIFRQVLRGERRMLTLLVLGSIPAGLAGVTLHDYIEGQLRHPLLIATTLSVFALLLWYWDRNGRKSRTLEDLTIRDSLVVGFAQALALMPGVSRSGVTITAGLLLGMNRPAAARFSFLLSAPITAAAGLLKAKHIFKGASTGANAATNFGVGFATSLISGLLALGLLNYILKNKTLNVFVGYRLALSFIIVVVVVVSR